MLMLMLQWFELKATTYILKLDDLERGDEGYEREICGISGDLLRVSA